MNIEIWSLGKPNEAFIDEGVRYYVNKLKHWCALDLVILQVPKKALSADPSRSKIAEEELVLRRLQAHHYLILLDERGKNLNSPEWSNRFQHMMNSGVKTAVILIGGAFGVSDNIKKAAKETWSLSALVFPHQLVRLIVAEQTYRAFSILNNSPYHHE